MLKTFIAPFEVPDLNVFTFDGKPFSFDEFSMLGSCPAEQMYIDSERVAGIGGVVVTPCGEDSLSVTFESGDDRSFPHCSIQFWKGTTRILFKDYEFPEGSYRQYVVMEERYLAQGTRIVKAVSFMQDLW